MFRLLQLAAVAGFPARCCLQLPAATSTMHSLGQLLGSAASAPLNRRPEQLQCCAGHATSNSGKQDSGTSASSPEAAAQKSLDTTSWQQTVKGVLSRPADNNNAPTSSSSSSSLPSNSNEGTQTHNSSDSSDEQARARTRAIGATSSPEQLLVVVQQYAAEFNHINLSAAYTRAVKLCSQGVAFTSTAVQQLLSLLHGLANQLQQQCGLREFSNIIWACGHLHYRDTYMLLLPVFLHRHDLQHAVPQDLSNVLWAMATLEDQLPAQQLSRVMAAFIEQLPAAKPQAVSNTLWAVASMGQQLTADQLQQLLLKFMQLLPEAKPQEVSNTLWAVASMGQQLSAGQLQQLLLKFMQLLPEAKPQTVSITLWAVATMGQHLSEGQLQQLLLRFVQLLPEAKPQTVSITLWAVATMGQHLSEGQLQQLLLRFVQLLPEAKPQDMSIMLWACGRLQYAPLQLLSALEQQLQSFTPAASPQHLANMAWACGVLGQDSCKPLTEALLQQAVQLLQHTRGTFNSQELCNLCWSAAVQDLQQCVPQVLQLAGAASRVWSTASDEGLQQLYQVHLWLLYRQLPADGQGLSGVLSQQQLQQCRASWEQQLVVGTAQSKASQLQQSVFAAVEKPAAGTWQQQPVMEERTADGAFSIDIAGTTAAGVSVAIEVDGPSHFVRPGNTLSGPSQSRNRALAARGYCVISIPYWEWNQLKTPRRQQDYLQAKLQAAVSEHQTAAAVRRVPCPPLPPNN